jgi:hypothetical protein
VILGVGVMVLIGGLILLPLMGGIALFRAVTGRASGKLRAFGSFNGSTLVTAGAMIAINEITAPLGYGVAVRDSSALALVEHYRPGLYLLAGLAIAAAGWGVRRLGHWAERKLDHLLERRETERRAARERERANRQLLHS